MQLPTCPETSLILADDPTLCGMIRGAAQRVVLLAPAISAEVGRALAEAWVALGPDAVSVTVDADPEVYRLGYGEFEALGTLQQAASSCGAVFTQESGIRVGLLIADDQTLVWAPRAALIEASAEPGKTTNAIRLGMPPADIERDLGVGADGMKSRQIGLDAVPRKKIDAVSVDLKINPPQTFDVCRTVRVFNAFFEFVEVKLIGADFARKTVKLPADLMGIVDAATQKKLRASFRLIDTDDGISGKKLFDDRLRLEKRYLRHIPGHGAVIKRTDKPAFLKDVEQLKKAIKLFRGDLKETLQASMDTSREELVQALLPVVTKTPPKRWTESAYYASPDDAKEFLDEDLKKAFGCAVILVGKIQFSATFKGVTYELLKQPDFIRAAQKAFPGLPKLFSEKDVAPPVAPLHSPA